MHQTLISLIYGEVKSTQSSSCRAGQNQLVICRTSSLRVLLANGATSQPDLVTLDRIAQLLNVDKRDLLTPQTNNYQDYE